MNLIISIVVFAASVFFLAVSLRYGLMSAARIDDYFSEKNNSDYQGFHLYFRIPFSFGVIPEYFYALVLSHDNYFKRNWWALKASSFISILIFIATLKSRSAVYSYFSLGFLENKSILGFFTSGTFVNFMNIIVLLYVALFVLVCIESIKMHGIYAPIRIAVYGFLSLFMANLTIITLSLIVFIAIVYVIIKIIVFLFTSSRRRRRNRFEDEDEDEETVGSILGGGLQEFRTELYEWEEEEKTTPNINVKKESKTKRKRPKITRRRKKTINKEDEIPRLHPD